MVTPFARGFIYIQSQEMHRYIIYLLWQLHQVYTNSPKRAPQNCFLTRDQIISIAFCNKEKLNSFLALYYFYKRIIYKIINVWINNANIITTLIFIHIRYKPFINCQETLENSVCFFRSGQKPVMFLLCDNDCYRTIEVNYILA